MSAKKDLTEEKRVAHLSRRAAQQRLRYKRDRDKILARLKTPNSRARTRKNRRAWEAREAAKNPNWRRPFNRRRTAQAYGITEDQYQAMHLKQGGLCAICEKPERFKKMLGIDHDHVSGTVRGLLCDPCNRGIGYLGDTYESVLKAVQYLGRFEKEVSNG